MPFDSRILRNRLDEAIKRLSEATRRMLGGPAASAEPIPLYIHPQVPEVKL